MAEVLKGLDGRYFGRDASGYMVSFNGLKAPDVKVGASGSEISVLGSNSAQIMATGSTATQITAGGSAVITATAAKDYGMAGPVLGTGIKSIVYNGGTTLAVTVTLAAGTIRTTTGSSCNKISMDCPGNMITLLPASTAEYVLLNKSTATVLSTA
jgi:hypothetical protein